MAAVHPVSQAIAGLRSLDMLRGVLAVYVMLGHCRWLLWAGHSQWMSQPHAAWLEPLVYASATLKFGREAVMVFFVLSGFFIHLRAAEQGRFATARLSAGRFYRRRLHRLGATYALALLVTVVCDLAGRTWFPTLYASATGDSVIDGTFRVTGYTWESVVPALFILPSSLGVDFGSNIPLWSLGYEVLYYALYPAWLAIRRRHPGVAFGLFPAVGVWASLWPEEPYWLGVIAYYPAWLAGAALAELWFRKPRPVIAPATIAAIFVAGVIVRAPSNASPAMVMSAMLFGSALVWGVASLGNQGTDVWPGRFLEQLGIRSYTIYIVHFPFVALMSAYVFEHGGRPMHGWFALVGAVAALAFTWLCFEACEKYFVHHRTPSAPPAA